MKYLYNVWFRFIGYLLFVGFSVNYFNIELGNMGILFWVMVFLSDIAINYDVVNYIYKNKNLRESLVGSCSLISSILMIIFVLVSLIQMG